MSVDELEKAITKLSSQERTRLIKLLEEMDSAEVDANLERDIKAGKFDNLADQALADHTAGKIKPL
jgi:Mg/Co/Ni transporter MgtE